MYLHYSCCQAEMSSHAPQYALISKPELEGINHAVANELSKPRRENLLVSVKIENQHIQFGH